MVIDLEVPDFEGRVFSSALGPEHALLRLNLRDGRLLTMHRNYVHFSKQDFSQVGGCHFFDLLLQLDPKQGFPNHQVIRVNSLKSPRLKAVLKLKSLTERGRITSVTSKPESTIEK